MTWNEGKTKIVQCVTMGNISHSETINKFHIKSEGSLTQINVRVLANCVDVVGTTIIRITVTVPAYMVGYR